MTAVAGVRGVHQPMTNVWLTHPDLRTIRRYLLIVVARPSDCPALHKHKQLDPLLIALLLEMTTIEFTARQYSSGCPSLYAQAIVLYN